MKVLISAIACEPGSGSEAKVGWDAIKAISKLHDCHVITHSNSRESIENAQSSGEASSVVFHYYGQSYTWKRNRLLARLQSWAIYARWQRELLPIAKALHQRYKYNLTHHLTYATWRVASPLWQLPIPFIWGPIGGAGNMPRQFRSILSPSARAFEKLRDLSNYQASASKAFRDCLRKSKLVLAATEETELFLRAFGTKSIIQRQPAVFFTETQLSALQRTTLDRAGPEKLLIFAGGNLIGSKGLALALRGLGQAKWHGLQFRFTIAGGGPEVHRLKALANRLGLQEVEFHPGLAGTTYFNALKSNDVYLMPSFRETAGITMLEAVIAGCYPIVANTSASGEIIRSVGGHALPLTNPDDMVFRIADALVWCSRENKKMKAIAASAGSKISRLFSESTYCEAINTAYARVLKC